MKYALIVGANSGLAQSVINKLKKDYIIFCADITYTKIEVMDNIHYIPVDVTNDESLINLHKYVSSVTSKIDVVSNFAGIVTLGSLVELPLDTINRIMNINFNSTYKINSLFFPLLKEAKGRIINISSEYARICGIPFHGYYAISKYAVEIYNESLRRELLSSGVKVICIRPGAFKTNMQNGIMNQFNKMVDETKMYKEPLMKMKNIMTDELDKAKSPDIFGEVYYKILNKKHPKRYYSVNNSFKMKVLSILPKWLTDFIFKIYF